MRLIYNWREVILDAYSMRAALAVAFIATAPEIAYLVLGFDIVSPYVKGWGTILGVLAIIFARVIDQGIWHGGHAPQSMVRRTLVYLGGALAIFALMVLLSVGGWLVRLI